MSSPRAPIFISATRIKSSTASLKMTDPTSVPLSNHKLFDGENNEWEEIFRPLFIASLNAFELSILRKAERPDDASSKALVNPHKMRTPPTDPGNSLDAFLATQNVTTFTESLEQGMPTYGAKDGCYISRQDAVKLYTTMQTTYQNWIRDKEKWDAANASGLAKLTSILSPGLRRMFLTRENADD